ncbi:AraC-like DNA-binding protein [Roseibium hamelinense]|uniref:AraC-like DNA-binding protein n=1 Tax=Roseibium hamelinense TaxID=150831 RepID=A0A562SUJ6_9HYPH|nr:AraC family transcriptional regulator [Roseibium hamelinense]MTI43043.1 AraC family transcriptional regulator [Roseibium hamelinense]TWI84654.1 AraC-like DNA-binding protein [Roseibium hamelinense]
MPLEMEWVRSDTIKVLKSHRAMRNIDWDALAREHSFDPAVLDDPVGVIPLSACLGIFEHVAQHLRHDSIMFDIFHSLDAGTFSVFDYLFLCAPDLRRACRAWVRFMSIRTNAYTVRFEENTDPAFFEWPLITGYGEWQQHTYARFGWAARQFEFALDDPAPPLRFEITTGPPKNPSRFLDRYRNAITFRAERNRIFVPQSLLDKPLPKNENNLYSIIEKAALEELEKTSGKHSRTAEIAQTISENLKTGSFSLANVAESLQVSQRDVQRALEKEGTSFRKLSEDVRKSAAAHFLTTTTLPLKEVAFLVGFSEPSTFSRAVKGWFGVSPRAFRQEKSDATFETKHY